MGEGVISVNVVNFITVGVMALIFVFLVRFAATKFGVKIPAVA